MSSILQLNENLEGKDYIIGDVHGSLVFEDVIALLKPADRLFIVGDLFDRGVANPEVYASIKAFEKQIFVVKGNHEEMLLAAMQSTANSRDIIDFLHNGGTWVLEDENTRNEIKIICAGLPRVQNKDAFLQLVKIVVDAFKTANKTHDLDKIVEYVSTLPYIIQVGKKSANPFVICHADMPFSDDRLNEMIQNNTDDFSPAEIQHITWARQKDYNSFKERDSSSTLVYCGHNTLLSVDDAVRADTNHINLDSGAYFCSTTLVVNHTDSNVFVIENREANRNMADPAIISHMGVLNGARDKIEQHLKLQAKAVKSIAADNKLENISDGKDIDKWFTDQLTHLNKLQQPQKYLTLLKIAIKQEPSPLTEEKKQQLKNFLDANKDHMLYDNPRNVKAVIELLDDPGRKRKFTP